MMIRATCPDWSAKTGHFKDSARSNVMATVLQKAAFVLIVTQDPHQTESTARSTGFWPLWALTL